MAKKRGAGKAARGVAAKAADNAFKKAKKAADPPPRRGTLPPGQRYHIPPATLPAFPGARRVRGKGPRATWKDADGNTYEFDRQHGTVEKYDSRGRHQGDYNTETGDQVGPADPGRSPQGS